MIKLIATDVDGTLVRTSSPEVYPEMLLMIKKLRAMGIRFCIASGRQYSSLAYMFAQQNEAGTDPGNNNPGHNDPGKPENPLICIADNGAHIRCGGEDLRIVKMDPELVRQLVIYLRGYKDCERIYESAGVTYIESDNEAFISLLRDQYRCNVKLVGDVLSEGRDILKVSIHRRPSIRQLGESELIPAWKDSLKATMAGEDWVDFMDPCVDKGNALHYLQERYGITPEETMVFGDNDNDTGMLDKAAYSYAVQSSPDEVKKHAAYICPDWTDKGVYRILCDHFGTP